LFEYDYITLLIRQHTYYNTYETLYHLPINLIIPEIRLFSNVTLQNKKQLFNIAIQLIKKTTQLANFFRKKIWYYLKIRWLNYIVFYNFDTV